MSIKSIIIDNKQTTAKRVAPDKVQLDLVALPLDEQNNTGPNMDFRLYVNGMLLQNIQSNTEGCIKESITIDNVDSEQITIKIQNLAEGVKSDIKCIMIQNNDIFAVKNPIEAKKIEIKTGSEIDTTAHKLYSLHQSTFADFILIDTYFKNIVSQENKHDMVFINQEFDKIQQIAQLKFCLNTAKELEFYSEYKDQIEKIISYGKTKMTIYEVNTVLEEVQNIINNHNLNIGNLRNRKQQLFDKEKEVANQIRIQNEETEKSKKEELKKTYIMQLKLDPSKITSLELRAKDDKEIVKYALEQDGLSLRYAGDQIKKDKDIIMIALRQNPNAFQFIADSLKIDEDFVIQCIKNFKTDILPHLPNYVKNLPRIKKEISCIETAKHRVSQKEEMLFYVSSIKWIDEKILTFIDDLHRLQKLSILYLKFATVTEGIAENKSHKVDKCGNGEINILLKSILTLKNYSWNDISDWIKKPYSDKKHHIDMLYNDDYPRLNQLQCRHDDLLQEKERFLEDIKELKKSK